MLRGVCAGVWEGENALEEVGKELAKRAEEAPMGRTLVEMRRLVRLIGEGVLLMRRDADGWGGFEMGALVGSLASKKLLLRV